MLARGLLAFVALEFALHALVVAVLVGGGTGWPAALATVAAIHVGIRALPVAFGTVVELLAGGRPPEAALGPVSWLRLSLHEVAIFLATYWIMPFEPWRRAEPPLAGPGAPRVVLVHGITCNRLVWFRFRRLLERRGFRAHAVNLEPVLGDLDAMARGLARALEPARGRALVLVCHSMGGLVARRFLQLDPGHRIAGVVTIGTPHHGAAQAAAAVGLAGRSLRRASAWLTGLDAGAPPPGEVRRASVWSWHDELVSPPASARWDGAAETTFVDLGHMGLLWDERVADAVAAELGRLLPEAAPSPDCAVAQPGARLPN